MKLGPIQERWVTSLEQNPERQMHGSLGWKNADGTYRACCLGEGGLIAGVCKWKEYGSLANLGVDSVVVLENYNALGLRGKTGTFLESVTINETLFTSLADMNDVPNSAGYCFSWKDIAAYIRANPENVFTHSV